MKNRSITILALLASCTLISSCGNKDSDKEIKDEFNSYVSSSFNASLWKNGSFSIALGAGYEFEDTLNISSLTLGGAFKDMKILEASKVSFEEENQNVSFYLSGILNEGSSGSIKGKGIVKNEEIDLIVPIEEAYLECETALNSDANENEAILELTNACFLENINPSHFTLDEDTLSVKSVEVIDFDTSGYKDGYLPNRVKLTIEGRTSETQEINLVVDKNALNYNKSLSCSIEYLYRGADLLNNEIDTYNLTDTLSFEAQNINFNDTIKPSDFTFEGVLKDYASVKSVEVIDKKHLNLELSFPCDFLSLDTLDNVGYIVFNGSTNEENVSFKVGALLLRPTYDFEFSYVNSTCVLEVTLRNEEFEDVANMTLIANDGEKDFTLNDLKIKKEGNKLIVTFLKNESLSGLINLTIKNAFSSIGTNGTKTSQDIKLSVNI